MSIPPDKRVAWYWQTDKASCENDKNSEWTKYSSIETEIIEEAYRNGQKQVELGLYRVDLQYGVHVAKDNKYNQRPIRCALEDRITNCMREERFHLPPQSDKTFYTFDELEALFFIGSCMQMYRLLPKGEKIEAVARGIEAEGTKLGCFFEAKWIARQFIALKDKSDEELDRLCIQLYTKECFLYKAVNKAMREQDYSKKTTLGPYIVLSYDYKRSSYGADKHVRNVVVYRGMTLNSNQIQDYRDGIGHGYMRWASCMSTSRSREKALLFGNTLFQIELKKDFGMDLSMDSDFPEEEEILLPPGCSFLIKKVDFDSGINRNVVDIYMGW